MAATAESVENVPWHIAAESFPEAELEARRKLAVFLGGTAVRGEASVATPERPNDTTFLAALQEAALGDEPSLEVVNTCVITDMAERVYTVGHQTRVGLQVVNDRLYQRNRPVTDVHRNTFEHTTLTPGMARRGVAEVKNVLLAEALLPTGVLNTHDVLVFEPTPTDMSQQEKADYNFRLHTETCSVQLLSLNGSEATLETALVAGKATPASQRHDIPTIQAMARSHGLPITETDGTGMIKYMMLIPKHEIPNGIVDVVKAYDDAAGGTFYGEAKPRSDYLAHAALCERRNRDLLPTAQRISEQLIAESAAFETPLEAIERLDYLSERLGVQYAVDNHDIQATVFGPRSASHIEDARFFLSIGDSERAEQSLRQAQETAVSGSCPIFKPSSKSGEGQPGTGQNTLEESAGKKWMTCPHCGARVFADPCASRLACWDCKAAVVNGRTVSKGNGGTKARAARAAAEQKKLVGV